MKRILLLATLLATIGTAKAQYWTNLPSAQQAAFITCFNRYNTAVTNVAGFRYQTNAMPSAWGTNAQTGEVTVTATTNQVVEVNPPIATRQLYYLKFYSAAQANENVLRKLDVLTWQGIVTKRDEVNEALANKLAGN